ncbi:MAG: UDP-N-acetylmuramate dehydrogenase [Bacilli bacterium]|nr:UDP-N-acetylmuramate dehydrogenase [Bacilli bacterium]
MKEQLKKLNCGEIIFDVSLKKYNTYNIGGSALALIVPNNIDELKTVISFAKKNNLRVKIIGNGSNLVFSDKYYEMLLINLKNFNNIEINENIIKVGSGVNLMKLAYKVSRLGLTGLEFATGIPATVGGAIYMNAGAYNSDMSNVLVRATILTDDLEIKEFSNTDFNFSYRYSNLQDKNNYVCLDATLKLENGNSDEILKLIEDRKNRRVSSQPLEYPSAGSVFRNPSSDIYAGKLIEDLGLKGHQIGGAMISNKHANFIINYDNASGDDIKKLIIETKMKVYEKYGIDLKIEQEFVE